LKKSVIIRKISLNDAGAIQKISNAISKNSSEINFEKLIQYKIANNEHETSLVAEIDNKVAGYMISNLLYAGFGLKKSAWIVTMGVKPDFMGQGLGVKLAKEIFQIYKKKNIEHIYSSVMWDSIDLLSFFKKLGFERSNFINLCKKL